MRKRPKHKSKIGAPAFGVPITSGGVWSLALGAQVQIQLLNIGILRIGKEIYTAVANAKPQTPNAKQVEVFMKTKT